MSKELKKKRKKRIRRMQGAFFAAAFLFLCVYFGGVLFYRTHFLRNTCWNGFDVSGKSSEEVLELLQDYSLSIVELNADGEKAEEKLYASSLGMSLYDDAVIENSIKEQNAFLWLAGNEYNFENKSVACLEREKLEEAVRNLNAFQNSFVIKPEDAHLSEYVDGIGYDIVSQRMGNELDFDKTVDVIDDAMKDLKEEVDLTQSDCYILPTVYEDDETLLRLRNQLNIYVNTKITYKFGDTEEIVDGNLIKDWLIVDKDKVSLDEDKVKEYVSSLRKKYDTIFRSREFVTSYDKTIKIEGGDYGWWMNYTEEEKELEKMLAAHESGERTPVYYQTAAQYGEKDYGDTYVEINLTAQHLFFYQDGALMLEADFVSGNESRGNGTPEGVYGITYKEKDATLVGENYATPVTYWMPFNGNIGLHDATWRNEFGGNLYLTSGSHGCINLPYQDAEKLYSYVQKGTPVICYKLPGTEQVPVTDPVTGLPVTDLTNPSAGMTDQNTGIIIDPSQNILAQ